MLDRWKSSSEIKPNVGCAACGNTMDSFARKEGKDVPIIDAADRVEAGVVELVELDEAGWTIVRPDGMAATGRLR